MHNLTDTTTGAVVATADAPWTWDAAGPGWRSGGHLVMDAGRAYAAQPVAPFLTVTEFIDLFTVPEEAAISASADQMVKVFYGRIRDPHRQVVHLDNPLVITGVGHCQAAGLLTAERAAAILAGQPPV